MKLQQVNEAKSAAFSSKVTQMRRQAEEMDQLRKSLIQELREIEEATGLVDKVARSTKGLNDKFVWKLYHYPGDLSTTMFVKILSALEKVI